MFMFEVNYKSLITARKVLNLAYLGRAYIDLILHIDYSFLTYKTFEQNYKYEQKTIPKQC